MQRLYTSLILLSAITASSQDCTLNFVDPIFDVQVESDVFYGTASTFDDEVDSLFMNIFKPSGDGQTERPVLVMVHGGGFYAGDRSDLDALCEVYASRGYLAATIGYRLGFHSPEILPLPYSHDPAEVVRAAGRAVQDLRGAIRFLKDRHLQDSTSVTEYHSVGFSAGAITVLHNAFVNDPSEWPAACDSIAMVDQQNMDYLRPSLGSAEGDLNLNGYDASVKSAASFFGGLLDTTYIDSPNDPALFLYHQTGDPVVGCNYQQGLWGMPFNVGGNYPYLYGSCVIDPHATSLGYGGDRYWSQLYNGNDHGLHDAVQLDLDAANWLSQLICPVTSVPELQTQGSHVWPNPVEETLNIELGDELRGVVLLQLMDATGRIIRSEQRAATSGVISLDMRSINSGAYFVAIEHNGQRTISRIIKR